MEEDQRRPIDSGDVNDYLREVSGGDFTAKDFRTWAGTVTAAQSLAAMGPASSQRRAQRNVVQAVEVVAKSLGNTPAIARKSYIHPAVIELYAEGGLTESWERPLPEPASRATNRLRADETRLLRLLKQRVGTRRRAAV
jgi:DNA topoisomerase I